MQTKILGDDHDSQGYGHFVDASDVLVNNWATHVKFKKKLQSGPITVERKGYIEK